MGKKILVVDDSATMRQQLSVFLKSNGFDVVMAKNGQEGVNICKTQPVELMIVDVNMPIMNGIEMIAEVRKIPAHAKTPIFVLTTETSKVTSQKGREAGATAWIVKPFKPDILLRGIQKVLRM